MKAFTYLEPKDLDEARALLAEHSGGAALLAGGVSLVPMLRAQHLTPDYVIDIKNLTGLDHIRADAGGVRIGALTTLRAIGRSSVVQELFPGLIDMERRLFDVQTRNWGTLGGNLSYAGRSGEPAAVLTALGATATLSSSRGDRTVAVKDFSTGHRTSVLQPDEIVVEVYVPHPGSASGNAYGKEARRRDHSPIVNVAAALRLDGAGQRIESATVVVGGLVDVPAEVAEAGSVLIGRTADQALLDEASTVAAEAIRPSSTAGGSVEYLREITSVLARRVLSTAIARCCASKGIPQ